MADNGELPDALSESPVEIGFKDMGGYFCHWHLRRNEFIYDIQLSKTMDGKPTEHLELRAGIAAELQTPVQTMVYFFFSNRMDGDSVGALYASPDARTIAHPSNRIN